MKILLITPELGYRGTPRTLANYARILKPKHEILVWGYDRGGETAEDLVREGFRVVIGAGGRAAALAFAPDVVNLHRASIERADETAILRDFKAQGAKCIETSVFGRVDESVEDLLDLSLQISQWDLFRWNAWKGNYRVPGVLFPNPVDTDRFVRASDEAIAAQRKEWGITDAGQFVIGRIGKTNWRTLGRPLVALLTSQPNVHFVHVEDYGGSNLPEALKNHPRVHIQPRMKGAQELSRFYSACDACVSMSGNGESFGFVNAEAMCCGTPVIALSTPLHDNAQVEMVANGRYGIVIGRPSMLPAACEKMMSDTAFHRQVASACRASIVERYSFAALSDRLKDLFERVHEGRPLPVEDQADLAKTVWQNLNDVMGESPLRERLGARLLYTAVGYKVLTWVKKLKG